MKKEKLHFKNYFFIVVVFVLLFTATRPVFSADIFFSASTQEIKVNQFFLVEILINTDGKDINAIEGEIEFPQNILGIEKISDGNSIISLWLEKPQNTGENNKINFSGIIPGGYNNDRGLVFSVFFSGKKEGNGQIKFNNVKILENNGQGTQDPSSFSHNLQFLVSRKSPDSNISAVKTEDNDPPENFKPEISSNPDVFSGKWFLVFATQDKGSGMDYFEVREGDGPFIKAESPYLLINQALNKKIIVKALDKNGNPRIVLLPFKYSMWYNNYVILTIVAGILLIYLIRRFLWIKRKK